MPIPEPVDGEAEGDYMARCVPGVIAEGKTSEQAVAICASTFAPEAVREGTYGKKKRKS